MGYGISVPEHVLEKERLNRRIAELERELTEQCRLNGMGSEREASLMAELETERMRLAACGVVAMSDTPESAAKARAMNPNYRSASCDDVARRVDECIALRAELAARDAKLDAMIDLFDRMLIPLSMHELRTQVERIKQGKLPVVRRTKS